MHGRHFVEQVAELNGHLHSGDMRAILETQLLGGSIRSNLISPMLFSEHSLVTLRRLATRFFATRALCSENRIQKQ